MLDDAEMLAARDSIPPEEWETLFLYHSAMMKALSSVVKNSNIASNEGQFTYLGEDSCSAELSSWLRYSDLDKQQSPTDLDRYYDAIYQFETLESEMANNTRDKLETVQSHYQVISYSSDPKTNDMCFYLDGTWQICTSYRPQYHEMGVHDTIRYLPNEPKRVLWVGGGDAMFLQEILKYPSLELAVGLELDQKVVRGAFKYFGTQPHWDNEKVQWWFGDASKSLLMIPEDYFGSFDVVLVDLSDTVLSLSVTKEMDIIGALSLLLRPGGVFAMNELVCRFIVGGHEHRMRCSVTQTSLICPFLFRPFLASFRLLVKSPMCSSTLFRFNTTTFPKFALKTSLWRAMTSTYFTEI
jgi:spermidine synthase